MNALPNIIEECHQLIRVLLAKRDDLSMRFSVIERGGTQIAKFTRQVCYLGNKQFVSVQAVANFVNNGSALLLAK